MAAEALLRLGRDDAIEGWVTEACLRQHDAIADSLFLLAAEDAIDRLG